MSNKMKCFWCHGNSNLGVHSKCWKVFSGWMLSSRDTADTCELDESGDDYLPNGQTYSRNGVNINQGRVMPSVVSE